MKRFVQASCGLVAALTASACILWVGSEPKARPGATAVVLATGQDHPSRLYVDTTFIHWTNSVAGGSVQRCALPSCDAGPIAVATNQGRPFALAAVEGVVVWTTLDSGGVRGVGADGGQAFELAQGIPDPTSLALSGSGCYVTERRAGAIVHCALPPASPDCFDLMPWGSEPGADFVIRANGRLYWLRNQTEIRTCEEGANCNPDLARPAAVTGLTGARSLVSDGTRLYWLDDQDQGSLRAAPLYNGTTTITDGGVALLKSLGVPTLLATDGQALYWTNAQDGTVKGWSKSDASEWVIASHQAAPTGIAALGGRVYWTTFDDGTVVSAPSR